MTEDQFLQKLLSDTKIAFEQSPIFKLQKQQQKLWSYSVCGTPIKPGKGIILGVNWGADGDHEPQTVMPDGKDIIGYKFIQRSRPYLEEHLKLDFEEINFNYSNLCFFRTPTADKLTNNDYSISLPLFKQYVDFIQPPWILSLAIGNYYKLKQLECLSDETVNYDNEGKHKGVVAKLWGYDFMAVPHPNARVKTKSRKEIWEKLVL